LHAGAKPTIVRGDTCRYCGDASHIVERYMPGTGQTVAWLFTRTPTFDRNQARPKALTATGEAILQNPREP